MFLTIGNPFIYLFLVKLLLWQCFSVKVYNINDKTNVCHKLINPGFNRKKVDPLIEQRYIHERCFLYFVPEYETENRISMRRWSVTVSGSENGISDPSSYSSPDYCIRFLTNAFGKGMNATHLPRDIGFRAHSLRKEYNSEF